MTALAFLQFRYYNFSGQSPAFFRMLFIRVNARLPNIAASSGSVRQKKLLMFNRVEKTLTDTIETMKILFIIYAISGGGAERAAVRLMNRLAEEHEVTACLLHPRGWKNREEYPLSGKVKVTELLHADTRLPGTRCNWLLRLSRLKKEGAFDVSISFLEEGNFLNAVTKHIGSAKEIISIRNLTSEKNRHSSADGLLRTMKKRLDRRADYVVCVSEDVAEDQIRHFGIPQEKIRVIRNWVDAEEVRMQADRRAEDPDYAKFREKTPFVYVNCGRLNVQKGQRHLIRAFRKLHREHPDTGLLILGSGPDEKGIRAEAERYGRDESILLPGRKANPFRYMKEADVFVLSSLYEGFSNSVLEAMALGLPVIADDCAGVRECLTPERAAGESADDILYGEYGIVTPLLTGDPEPGPELTWEEDCLYRAMKAMYERTELRQRYRERGPERVRDFTEEKIMKQWTELLKETR